MYVESLYTYAGWFSAIWSVYVYVLVVPLISLLAAGAAIDALIFHRNKLDSEDKMAIILILIGMGLFFLGGYWKQQLFWGFNERGEYLEKMDVYYKMALEPMLLQTIGPTLISLSAFIRTKTRIIPKVIALIYILNVITVNFEWFIAGSHML